MFQRCQPDWIPVGLGSLKYGGISATEIRAAADLLDIDRAHYPDILFCLDVLIEATRDACSVAA